MAIAAHSGVTKPEAGVTATSPATRPEAKPRAVGLPRCSPFDAASSSVPPRRPRHSAGRQGGSRHAVADAQSAAAVEAEPAEPEQPRPEKRQHHAIGVHGMLGIADAVSAAPGWRPGPTDPAAMWTTVPPAKSSAPILPSQPAGFAVVIHRPDPVSQRVIDQSAQRKMNRQYGPKRIALGHGAADQGRRDDGEHPLVHAVDVRSGCACQGTVDWRVRH